MLCIFFDLSLYELLPQYKNKRSYLVFSTDMIAGQGDHQITEATLATFRLIAVSLCHFVGLV
jgi:hypothetical protein